MEDEGMILMKQKDLKRLKVLEQAVEKKIVQRKAAEWLGLSERQVRRLVQRMRAEGAKGLLHGLRGKASNRRCEKSFKEKVLGKYQQRYEGFGPTLACEKLSEKEKIEVSRETLRKWLIAEGLWKKRRHISEHHKWRERKECFGEMVQADGSHHDWLEARGPKLVMMGYSDDATGNVFARFYDYEGIMPAMDSFYRYVKCYGLPLSLYMDRHTTYQVPEGTLRVEEELEGKEKPVTEFGRALEELGVKLIAAYSPQAKGRIERLLGTFQDRLIKEMRLEGIKTKEEANRFLERYLPKYNRRFSVKAKNEVNVHGAVSKSIRLEQVLSIQTKRAVRNDHTIRHANQFYQILDKQRSKEVVVQERVDGKLYITDEGKELEYRKVESRPKQEEVKKISKPRKLWKPPMSHPYKQRNFEACAPIRARKESLALAASSDPYKP